MQIRISNLVHSLVWLSVAFALSGYAYRENPVGTCKWVVFLPCNPYTGCLWGGAIGALVNRVIEGCTVGLIAGFVGAWLCVLWSYAFVQYG